MKRFAFVMDPLEALDLPWDTSLCLLRELSRRGHKAYLFTSDSLAQIAGKVYGSGRLLQPAGHLRYRRGRPERLPLSDFDAVFIRKDPPFDGNYLALTYLLEPLAKKTLVINHPRGIRNANEKLFGLSFSKKSPATIVSANSEEILAFQRRIRSDLVVKPLYEKGGKGIFILRCRGGFETRPYKQLKKATRGGKEVVLAQKFLTVPKGSGDKRILIWKGRPLGAFLRVPRPGEFRSNLSLGGQFYPCRVTAQDHALVREMRPMLLREGLLFVGIDVRAGKLIEVNVTSPAGLVELDRLYGGASVSVADDLERM